MKKQYTHIQQQGESDCGIACLKMVLQHLGSDASFERLCELSGTTITGTTMLGLLQAGNELGLDTEGFECDLENLQTCRDVCILHVLINETLQHYVVYYGYDTKKQHFIIANPAQPKIQYLSAAELEQIWVSKSLLLLKPTDKLIPLSIYHKNQRVWFWSFIKEDLNLLIIAAVLGVLLAVLGLTTALFSQKLIDKILPAHDYLKLYTGVGLLFALLLARIGMSYIRQLFLMRQSRDMNIRLVDFFYSSILHLPKSFFDNRKTGELVARMNDTRRIQQTITRIVGDVAIDILLIVASIITIFSYDAWIGLLSVLWLPIFVGIVRRFHNHIIFGQREVMAANAQNESNFISTMQGAETIKVSNGQGYFSTITKTIYSFFQKTIYDLGLVGLKFSVTTEAIGTVFIVAVILGSSVLVLRGALTMGAIIAILQMVGMLMGSAGRLATTNIQLQEAKVAFERMDEFTSIQPEFNKEADVHKVAITDFREIRFDNVTFRFKGRKRILEDISFTLRKGQSLALIGEIGSGKSTTLQILQKFYTSESGQILVNNVDFSLLSTQHWRSMIGVMPQQVKFFNGTIIANILMGDSVKDTNHLISFFKFYGFDTYFERFPNGYATMLGEHGVELSVGQVQLVGLARALWRNPQLLLLDEPSASLDNETEKFVLDILDKIKENAAILVLTHKKSVADWADNIYSLEAGVTKTLSKNPKPNMLKIN